MTTSDYLINGLFVLVVLRQARERRLDLRGVVAPLVVVAYVAHIYIHSLPTAGNDLVLVAALSTIGLTLGIASGLATSVRAAAGSAYARVGWVAGLLLVFGICSRMVFVFAVNHGFRSDVASFSMTHRIGGAAWPVALVAMALCEVVTRIAIVQLRGRRLITAAPAAISAVA